MTEPTTETIRTLQREAQRADDRETAWHCHDALRGSPSALREVQAILEERRSCAR